MRTLLLASLSAVLVSGVASRAVAKEQQQPIGCDPVRVHFAFDSSELTVEDEAKLDRSADCLKNNQRLKVSIQGNADERGSSPYNIKLGDRRAQSVQKYLLGQGVSQQQLSTISFGKDNPLCRGHEEGCWKHNRRAAIEPACRL